jgi:undecaprenyl diphosphate synthase
MDGNGRWAQEKSKPRVFGHQEGGKKVSDVIEAAIESGVKALTLYAFSEENWGRPQHEVNALFQLLTSYLEREVLKLNRENIRFRAIGNLKRLPERCQNLIAKAEQETLQNDRLILTLALSYGSRSEIVESCRSIGFKIKSGLLDPSEINHDVFAQHLYANNDGLADPDLLIRTSGEQRISNFLLWQIAYTELYFSPVFWPDFSKEHFKEAIRDYQNRQRRYGKVSESIST